ncbi:MAG: flagellar basal body L-ring protein FlgH [Marinomonas sp.]|jgi:flagellar L-ring protein precursor FlgH|uniref:flagellar basal body L-ring protein FlgH n=1 Tax=unclassified Marinomonas TaxID=196814 RepID=UPI00061F21AA|nr:MULTISPECIES: flagellar basal body L-ring protein FlgH [unclassified Marinomonas]KJZ14662.1 flagellar L-ring protein FlgH [Marinomonas sp. S3726]KZM40975.1 flagellar L-ring protein FlgH [Marinomonas sp. SBI22]KZM42816.1 flagellar L-ring protein FlgH [Marinomonas sp. SBI8L]
MAMVRFTLLLALFLTGCASWEPEETAEEVVEEPAVEEVVEEEAPVEEVIEGEPEKVFEPAPEHAYVPEESDPFNAPDMNYGPRSDDPYYAPVIKYEAQPSQNVNGGIYKVGMGDVFFGSQTASRVGDILTINLSETTSSSKSNDASLTKSSSAQVQNPRVVGTEVNIDSVLPDGGTNFAGSAGANQSNSLNGTITVTVYDVYPNGVLAVRGEKWVTLNRGDEYIRLTGIIRKQDIKPNNTIDSARVADARITYSGSGEIASGSEQGWVTRLLNRGVVPN